MREHLKAIGLAIAAVGVGLGATASWVWADRRPAPDGARAVGVRELVVSVPLDGTDAGAGASGRELSATVYYPAEGAAGEVVPAGLIDGPLAPLVVWTHDALGAGDDHESLAQSLASRGHVVVTATHPGLAASEASAEWRRVVEGERDPLVVADSEAFRTLVPLLQADQAALVREVVSVAPGLELGRIVYGGQGVGGALAIHSCLSDERCVAVVDFGGAPLFEQLPGGLEGRAVLMPPGLEQPLLTVVAENVLRDRAALPAMTAMRAMATRSTGPSSQVVLTGAGVLDLSDRPLLVQPSVLRWQVGDAYWVGEADAAEGMDALRELVGVFLERHARRNGGVDEADVVASHDRLRAR